MKFGPDFFIHPTPVAIRLGFEAHLRSPEARRAEIPGQRSKGEEAPGERVQGTANPPSRGSKAAL